MHGGAMDEPLRFLGELQAAVQGHVAQMHANLRRTGERAARMLSMAALPQRQQAGAMLASIGARLGGGAPPAALATPAARPPNALFDLAFNPKEIEARLSGVPVFTVVNQKNEFVLVSGDDGDRQLGLFFFSEPEAEAMLKTIKQLDPKVGKQAKLLHTTMDRVYEFTTTPRADTDTKGVVFRFVPDPRQVEAALQLYRHAGVPHVTGFQGVPLFQAEGLTIRGDSGRFTPLFFSKDDLDAALSAAFNTKDASALADTRAKAERAREEVQEAKDEAAAAKSDRQRKAAQRKAGQAEQRLKKYEQRLAESASSHKLPKVDVGSLEEVIGRMEADEKGDWGDVVFMPPQSVVGPAAGGKSDEGAAKPKGKGKGKGK